MKILTILLGLFFLCHVLYSQEESLKILWIEGEIYSNSIMLTDSSKVFKGESLDLSEGAYILLGDENRFPIWEYVETGSGQSILAFDENIDTLTLEKLTKSLCDNWRYKRSIWSGSVSAAMEWARFWCKPQSLVSKKNNLIGWKTYLYEDVKDLELHFSDIFQSYTKSVAVNDSTFSLEESHWEGADSLLYIQLLAPSFQSGHTLSEILLKHRPFSEKEKLYAHTLDNAESVFGKCLYIQWLLNNSYDVEAVENTLVVEKKYPDLQFIQNWANRLRGY